MSEQRINLTLKIWRQKNRRSKGRFDTYRLDNVSTDASFLEMLDELNEKLTKNDQEPVAFDHDCREGICGACGAIVNGQAHGPQRETTLCQLHMRNFKDEDIIVIEPFRARAFPVIKDLVADRSAYDRIIQAGGYISINTGNAQDANAILVPKEKAEEAMDSAACIGCGACVAACPNASALLFVGAKITQLSVLPQGEPEKYLRVKKMVEALDKEGFGNCSNEYECEAACPKSIKVSTINRMNKDFLLANLL